MYNFSQDKLTELTSANFDKFIKENPLTLIEFYAPWCGHCKSLAPEMKKLGAAFHPIIKIGVMDASDKKNESIASKYGIKGFPTLKIFKDGQATDYNGGRTMDAMKSEIHKAFSSWTGGKKGNGSSGGSDSGSSSGSGSGSGPLEIEVDDNSFAQKVYGGKNPAIVFFYAPWCGHCNSLKPEFTKAAKKLKGKVDFIKYDADANKGQSATYDIKGFPTLYWFDRNSGTRSRKDAVQYTGGRTEAEMVTWMNSMLAKDKNLSVDVYEVFNNATYDDKCKNGAALCGIVFLPLVENSSADGRNKYVATLKEIQKTLNKRSLDTQLVWIGAQTQPELELAFQVDLNYPTLILTSSTKTVYSKYVGTLNEKDVVDFVWQMKNRPKGLVEYTAVKLKDGIKWDGKDVIIESEELDEDFLNDILNETKKEL